MTPLSDAETRMLEDGLNTPSHAETQLAAQAATPAARVVMKAAARLLESSDDPAAHHVLAAMKSAASRSGVPADGDALAQVMSLADREVAAGRCRSRQAAVARVFKQHPDLYLACRRQSAHTPSYVGSAVAEAERRAAVVVGKAANPMILADAMAQAFRDDPRLYADYCEEVRSGVPTDRAYANRPAPTVAKQTVPSASAYDEAQRRALRTVGKAADAAALGEAVVAVFRADPALYERHREEAII